MSVAIVGTNHRTVPLEALERLLIAPRDLPKALADLVARPHLDEVVVLSTCMRTEVYALVNRFHGAMADIREFLVAWSGAPPEELSGELYSYFDESAVHEAAAERRRDLVRKADPQVNGDVAVLVVERLDQGRHEVVADRRRAAHEQFAGKRCAGAAAGVLELDDLGQQALDARQQRATAIVQHKAVAHTREQRPAERALELLERHAGRGLREVQALGTARHAAQAGDAGEDLELADGERHRHQLY